MITQFTTKSPSRILVTVLIAVCCAATLAPVHALRPEATKARLQYQESTLPDFGDTSSGGNRINDPTCCSSGPTCHQVRQFRPAVWQLGPPDVIHDLPLISGDSSGAATAINDNGQIVGISGICDQAVGRHTARHAVLWENGTVTDIYPDAPAPWWNTPTAINQHGDVVGFAGDPAFVEGDIVHAFMWTKDNGINALNPLRG